MLVELERLDELLVRSIEMKVLVHQRIRLSCAGLKVDSWVMRLHACVTAA